MRVCDNGVQCEDVYWIGLNLFLTAALNYAKQSANRTDRLILWIVDVGNTVFLKIFSK